MDLENRIVWSASNADKAIKSITDVEKASQKAVKANTDIAASAVKADKALAKIDGRNLTKAGQATDTITKGLRDAEKAAVDLDARLEQLDTNFSKISTQVGQAGDLATGVSSIGGAVTAIPGLGGAGGAVSGAAGVFDFVEQLPRLKAAASGLPELLQKSAQASGSFTSGLATALIPVLGATGASVAALTIVALPLIAATATLAIGMKELDKRNREAAEGVRLAAEARQIEADTERQFAQLSIDEQVAERNRLFEERAQLAQRITDENAILAEKQKALDESSSFGLLDSTRSARDEQKKIVDDLITQAAEAGVALQVADDALAELSQAELNAASFRVEHAEAIREIQEDITRVEGERTQAMNQLEQGLARVTQLEEQRTNLIEQRAQNEQFALEQSNLDAKFAAEDQIAQEQELRDNLTQIANDSLERIAAIDTEIGNLRVEREQALADVVSKGQDKLGKINQDYFSKTLADTRKFQKETERLEEDNKKARLKLIADITDRLNAAESDNNVIAFLQAQSDGAKQLKEQAQSANETEKRRAEDFAASQEQAAEAQRQRIAETLAGIEEEKARVIEAFNERRAELVATREAEKVAAQEAQAQAIANYQEQEAREQQQAERQAERDELRKQQEEIRFQEQLDAIEEQKQAQLAANHEIRVSIDGLTTLATNLQNRIAAANAQAQTSASQSSSSSTSSQGSSPFSGGMSYSDRARAERNGMTAFADGGIISKPTIALMGERKGYNEMVIPFKKSEGLPPQFRNGGMGGGNNINVTIPVNMTVGDIATGQQVKAEGERVFNTVVYDVILPVIENALAGRT